MKTLILIQNKKNLLLTIFLMLISSSLLPVTIQLDNNQSNFFGSTTRGKASGTHSSYDPKPCLSGSGKRHLLFMHETFSIDVMSAHSYHSYEMSNGSWSIPKKIPDNYGVSVSVVQPSKAGIVIFYWNNGIYKDIYKREFDEQTGMWLEPVSLINTSKLFNCLALSKEDISHTRIYFHSLLHLEDESFVVVWSFNFYYSSGLSHELEESYFVSSLLKNGSMSTQVIEGYKSGYQNYYSFIIVYHGNSFFVYNNDYSERARILQDGNRAFWRNTRLKDVVNIEKQSKLIGKRYLSYYKDQYSLTIYDLTLDSITEKNYSVPQGSSSDLSDSFSLDIRIENETEVVFSTVIYWNGDIELWNLNYSKDTWIQIDSLNCNFTEKPFDFDLLIQNSKMMAFWNQGYEVSEIFTVIYTVDTKEWSSITQITDTRLITDDHTVWKLPIILVIIIYTVGLFFLGIIALLILLILGITSLVICLPFMYLYHLYYRKKNAGGADDFSTKRKEKEELV